MVECLYCESSETYEDGTESIDEDLEKRFDAALEGASTFLTDVNAGVERGWVTKYGCEECGARFELGEATIAFSRVTKDGDLDKRIV